MGLAVIELASLFVVWYAFGFLPALVWFFALWTIKLVVKQNARRS